MTARLFQGTSFGENTGKIFFKKIGEKLALNKFFPLSLHHQITQARKGYKTQSMLLEENPIYKIQHHGVVGLSDLEVLTAIIASSKELNAQTKARYKALEILNLVSGDIRSISKMSKRLLCSILSDSEYYRLVTSLEFGRRVSIAPVVDRQRINSSRDAYNQLRGQLESLSIEEAWVLLLNKTNEVISKVRLSVGGTSGTVVDAKVIFQKALEHKASGIILAHNHPSGNLNPSQADIDLTRRCKRAGEVMDLPVLDHLIISERGYYSFADEGAI